MDGRALTTSHRHNHSGAGATRLAKHHGSSQGCVPWLAPPAWQRARAVRLGRWDAGGGGRAAARGGARTAASRAAWAAPKLSDGRAPHSLVLPLAGHLRHRAAGGPAVRAGGVQCTRLPAPQRQRRGHGAGELGVHSLLREGVLSPLWLGGARRRGACLRAPERSCTVPPTRPQCAPWGPVPARGPARAGATLCCECRLAAFRRPHSVARGGAGRGARGA